MSDEIDKMVMEIEDAASLCNDELGEYWDALTSLNPGVYDGGSEEFVEAYEREVRSQHERLKTEFRIVKTVRTRSIEVREILHISEIYDEDCN